MIRVGNVVSLKPSWLSLYAIDPLLAPDKIGWHASTTNGRMTREDVETAIRQYLQYLRDHELALHTHINIDMIFKMLEDMGVSFRLEDGTYMFPSHLPFKTLCQMWKRVEQMEVYVGRRLFCSSPKSIFNPSVFALFQCQACVNLDVKSILWRDGIIIPRARKSYVECLAAMVDPLRAVDFVARGTKGSELECLSLLDDVMREWKDMVEKHSCGTTYQMAYLSRKHLTEHKDRPAVYSEEEVKEAIRAGSSASVTTSELSEPLDHLLVFRPEEQSSATEIDAEISHGFGDEAVQRQVSS